MRVLRFWQIKRNGDRKLLNGEKVLKALEQYKIDFSDRWPGEKYKWEAVRCFQEHWDIYAKDFAGMFLLATGKTFNLLASINNFPRKMMADYARQQPEMVREMFRGLYDETIQVEERILNFQKSAQELCDELTPGMQHYQRPMAITVYLWLKYPDKYDIFKYSVCKSACIYLGNEFIPKMGKTAQNIEGNRKMIDELLVAVNGDDELLEMFQDKIDERCDPDQSHRTLVFDILFYIANYLSKQEEESCGWIGESYNPGITKNQWLEFLKDETIFNRQALEIVARMYDYGGQATCSQLSVKYGETVNFYNWGSSALAKRIIDKTDCELRIGEDGKERRWSVLYFGRAAKKEEDGVFVWKLRDELKAALKEIDLSSVALYANKKLNAQETGKEREPYTKEDFLEEVYMAAEKYDTLKHLLLKKQNIILQGAPGVGKTFAAKRLAYSVMGEKDESRIKFIQFHQNYSYEDFVMGYKPDGDGFCLKMGVFYRFCKEAQKHPDKEYFFIIDEINRGNMSKIFGELLMLIEKNYRGTEITLGIDEIPFCVPENLYMIGMMNTADRSLAMIDYALRRRFSFFTMEPAFESDGFCAYQKSLKNETFDSFMEVVISLNQSIAKDASLGKGFCIGHSYFCEFENECEEMTEFLSSVLDYDILPLLEEYWFDEPDKIALWKNRLQGVLENE